MLINIYMLFQTYYIVVYCSEVPRKNVTQRIISYLLYFILLLQLKFGIDRDVPSTRHLLVTP